jgi:hypothetical protein
MTRKKKTRSLKRIHSVKTGTPSKLKRSSTTDRQSSIKTKDKPKSVYQKFLDENPDAIEKQIQPVKEVAAKPADNTKPEPLKDKDKAKPKKSERENPQEKDSSNDREREPDLLSQLDNKNFNDFY